MKKLHGRVLIWRKHSHCSEKKNEIWMNNIDRKLMPLNNNVLSKIKRYMSENIHTVAKDLIWVNDIDKRLIPLNNNAVGRIKCYKIFPFSKDRREKYHWTTIMGIYRDINYT